MGCYLCEPSQRRQLPHKTERSEAQFSSIDDRDLEAATGSSGLDDDEKDLVSWSRSNLRSRLILEVAGKSADSIVGMLGYNKLTAAGTVERQVAAEVGSGADRCCGFTERAANGSGGQHGEAFCGLSC